MSALEKVKSAEVQPATSDNAAVLSLIERLVLDPNVDVSKVERMFDLQERLIARNQEAAYNAALAIMQPSLPEIEHKGKGNNEKSYAKWEDIHSQVTPILTANGFALTFRTSDEAGRIKVTAVLRHRDGHSDETSITLPSDQSGGKNAVQAVGSSVSYGKRYAACALLNIRTRGEDDDGKAASKKTSKIAGGGSMRDASREQLDAVDRGEEPGLEIPDPEKDPLWDDLKEELHAHIATRDEAAIWLRNKKTSKQGKYARKHPSWRKAFYERVYLPYEAELPEVPA